MGGAVPRNPPAETSEVALDAALTHETRQIRCESRETPIAAVGTNAECARGV
jgi:hypothetical protein